MMQIFRMLQRGIRDAFKSVVRNFSLSIASIICVSITLFIVSVAIILTANVNNFSTNIKQDVTIIAFLEKNHIEYQKAPSKLVRFIEKSKKD